MSRFLTNIEKSRLDNTRFRGVLFTGSRWSWDIGRAEAMRAAIERWEQDGGRVLVEELSSATRTDSTRVASVHDRSLET